MLEYSVSHILIVMFEMCHWEISSLIPMVYSKLAGLHDDYGYSTNNLKEFKDFKDILKLTATVNIVKCIFVFDRHVYFRFYRNIFYSTHNYSSSQYCA